MKKYKILFVHVGQTGQLSSFMNQDLQILRQKYDVEELGLFGYSHMLRDPMFDSKIWRGVARNDLVFAWFGTCAPVILVARVLGKPSVLVGGGHDIVSLPEIGYGLGNAKWWQEYPLTLGFRLANRVLLFSDSSRRTALTTLGKKGRNLQTLYLGVDADAFKPEGSKCAQVLTVGYMTRVSIKRKGIDLFIKSASLNPDVQYHLAGKLMDQSVLDDYLASAPANLSYLGFLDNQQLLHEYQQSRVYAQLSMHEGFGLAIAEAMACECIPVVTNVGSIPEVVGDAGIFVRSSNPTDISAAIQQALSPDNAHIGKIARERVVDMFPIAKRSRGLEMVVEEVMS